MTVTLFTPPGGISILTGNNPCTQRSESLMVEFQASVTGEWEWGRLWFCVYVCLCMYNYIQDVAESKVFGWKDDGGLTDKQRR